MKQSIIANNITNKKKRDFSIQTKTCVSVNVLKIKSDKSDID